MNDARNGQLESRSGLRRDSSVMQGSEAVGFRQQRAIRRKGGHGDTGNHREEVRRVRSGNNSISRSLSGLAPSTTRSLHGSMQYLFAFCIFALFIVNAEALPQTTTSASTSSNSVSSSGTGSRPAPSNTSSGTRSSSSSSTSSPTASPSSNSTQGTVVNSADVPTDVRPFDTNLGRIFSSESCPQFFESFLNNQEFKNCLPLSTLVENSQSFFTAQQAGLFTTTNVLDKTCNVNQGRCRALMDGLGRQIRSRSACAEEYDARNGVVVRAYAAFLAYQPMFSAGCMKSDTGNYCYAEAVSNTTSTADTALYHLALGKKLPDAARPSCSACTNKTMAVFAQFAGNRSNPLTSSYKDAADRINSYCGAEFASTVVSDVGIPFSGALFSARTPAGVQVVLTAFVTVVVGMLLL